MKYTDEQLFRLNLIRLLRVNKWTQKRFSQITGIDESIISKLINGTIPFTVERVSIICQKTGLMSNEFYEEKIRVENNYEHVSVYLADEVAEVKPKRKRQYKYERLEYKFTAREFEEVKRQWFDMWQRGQDERLGAYPMKVAEEPLPYPNDGLSRLRSHLLMTFGQEELDRDEVVRRFVRTGEL